MSKNEDKRSRIKFLVITDVHNKIQNVRKVISKIKTEKFDYVLYCGDAITMPSDENDNQEKIDSLMPLMHSIFLELEKIAPILWVPGNHEPYMFFTDKYEEVSSKSKNLHKKYQKLENNLYIVGLGGSTPILTGGKWSKDFIPFKDIDFSKIRYTGYPYNADTYIQGDQILANDLNEVLNEGKKVWGDSQLILLTHSGPVYTFTSSMEEDGEYLYLGSKNLGEIFQNEDNCFINIHGHSHLSDGFVTLRPGKYVFNPGANYYGNYGKIEIVKDMEGKWTVFSDSIGYI
jgi:Icc-related predicted phosphoesterase